MNIHTFAEKKHKGEKISMITCYDYTSAKIAAESLVDCILVGDSLAMTMHGHPTTLKASVNLMALHTAAVKRGAPKKFLIGDLPFLSFRKSLDSNMTAIEKIMKAGAESVKLEGARGNLDLIHHVVESGIPVMGHLGLTPQSLHQLGGYKVQAKAKAEADQLIKDAKDLEAAGCFSIVLECVPMAVAKEVTAQLHIPTIGIGAGNVTDGQVLVWQDLLGMNHDFKPKFVRSYLDGFRLISEALNSFHNEVQDQSFPNKKESYE